MRITQWGEYGVHCSLYIAQRTNEGVAAVSAAEIAESQRIALQYTQQILQRLREGDVIKSVRGPRGGYLLARPAEEITLLDILVAAEGDSFELICQSRPLSETRCAPEAPCTLRPVWYGLREHVNQYLKDYTLAGILEQFSCASGLVQISNNSKQDSFAETDECCSIQERAKLGS